MLKKNHRAKLSKVSRFKKIIITSTCFISGLSPFYIFNLENPDSGKQVCFCVDPLHRFVLISPHLIYMIYIKLYIKSPRFLHVNPSFFMTYFVFRKYLLSFPSIKTNKKKKHQEVLLIFFYRRKTSRFDSALI